MVSGQDGLTLEGFGLTDVHVTHGPFSWHIHPAVTCMLVMIHVERLQRTSI